MLCAPYNVDSNDVVKVQKDIGLSWDTVKQCLEMSIWLYFISFNFVYCEYIHVYILYHTCQEYSIITNYDRHLETLSLKVINTLCYVLS